jgi:hypothetical protein
MALPPSLGADHVTEADALPAVATTLVGALGTVGADVLPLSRRVAISHTVLEPVFTVAFGVAPDPTTWSAESSSMSPVGATLTLVVQPLVADRASPKPESA